MTPSLALALSLLGPASAAEAAEQADSLYVEGKYAEASAAYAEAYSSDPDPQYLYAWAQSERRAGNCPRAVELYREYASLPVSQDARDAAATNARRCGEDINKPPPPRPTVEPQPDPRTHRRARPKAWRKDAIGLSLIAGGGALGAAALVLAVDSRQQWRRADEATVETQYARNVDRAVRSRTAAVICGSVGGVAFAAGVVRLMTLDEKKANTAAWIPGRGVRF